MDEFSLAGAIAWFCTVIAICATVVTVIFALVWAGHDATQRTNDRLARIGTACVTAGHVWINNNCIITEGAK